MNINSKRFKEIIRFCIVGAILFVFDYGLLYFFTEIMHVNYLYSVAVSFIAAVILNY